MRPSGQLARILLASALLSPLAAPAAQVRSWDCRSEGPLAICAIRLEGEVSEGDRLFLSTVHERDRLRYGAIELGSTGSLFGRGVHAGLLPRLYSLAPLRGARSPELRLEAAGGLLHPPGIPMSAKVKVVDEGYPLHKLLGPSLLQLLAFFFLGGLSLKLLRWPRSRKPDGWLYPTDELRWLLGGLGAYLVLRHEAAGLFVPLLWSSAAHGTAAALALAVALWSLNVLLLGGRFFDGSSIERDRAPPSARAFHRLAHLAFLASLGVVIGADKRALALPALSLVLASAYSARYLGWRRTLKRSGALPLFFHAALMLLAPCAALAMVFPEAGRLPLQAGSWAVLLLAGLGMRSQSRTSEKNAVLAAECRALLAGYPSAEGRLQALCDFIAEEWGAARASILSVDGEDGLVLASGGPEAIPPAGRAEARRLGPFLRRICKQGRMLYAPVAEELGQDLQSQGLKHSSLAIPFAQEGKIRAVACMMADEGDRIPPADAAQLAALTETLSLEILSAVAQQVAESKSSHLLDIARTADALAVENLDHWGQAHHSQEPETRVVLGGDCVPADPFLDSLKRSPVLGAIWSAHRAEVRAHWAAVTAAFEFIPKDNRDDFWVISPRAFHSPLLRELGAERVALLLASALDRQARALSAKSCYGALGYCGVRLACGEMSLRRSPWHGSAVEIDSDQFTLLLELRRRAEPGTVLFRGDAPALAGPAFLCRSRAWEGMPGKQIFSILSTGADKKEIRRIEAKAQDKAQEKMRGLSRKAA